MAHNETFEAIIKLNNEEVRNKIEETRRLQREAADELVRLKKKESNATKEQIAVAEHNLQTISKRLEEQQRHARGLSAALQTVSKKNYFELRQEVKALNKLMRDGSVEKGTKEWKALPMG